MITRDRPIAKTKSKTYPPTVDLTFQIAHPPDIRDPQDKNQDNKDYAEKKFKAERGVRRSIRKKKEIYDQYGEDGRRSMARGYVQRSRRRGHLRAVLRGRHGRRRREPVRRRHGGGFSGGMAGSEPSSADARGFLAGHGHGHGGHGARREAPARKKADPIEQVLRLTLEEMYYGVQKNLKLTRTVIRGGAEQRVSETPPSTSSRSWKKGTKITFRRRATSLRG